MITIIILLNYIIPNIEAIVDIIINISKYYCGKHENASFTL